MNRRQALPMVTVTAQCNVSFSSLMRGGHIVARACVCESDQTKQVKRNCHNSLLNARFAFSIVDMKKKNQKLAPYSQVVFRKELDTKCRKHF